jgi:hypothetical protein
MYPKYIRCWLCVRCWTIEKLLEARAELGEESPC